MHVCQPSMWNLPSLLNCILGYDDMGAKQGRETLILNAKKHCLGGSENAQNTAVIL